MSNAEGNTGSNDGDPPELNVNLPSAKDVDATPKHRNAAPLPVDVLLLTVKDCDFLACYRQLINPFQCWFDEIGFVYFENAENGEKVRVALGRCWEGSVTPGGSLITVTKAVPVLQPKAVISVGTCSSLDPNKANLGDVIVSAKLKELSTGMRNYVSRRFLKVINYAGFGYKAPLQDPEAREIKVHCDGEFLSGPELVCSETRRKELAQCHPQAIGVETEGGGVFTAAFEDQIEWLIVKGITDYADGDEPTTERWSPFASVMAASVVQHILSNPYVFSSWPHYCSEGSSTGRTEQSAAAAPDKGLSGQQPSSDVEKKGCGGDEEGEPSREQFLQKGRKRKTSGPTFDLDTQTITLRLKLTSEHLTDEQQETFNEYLTQQVHLFTKHHKVSTAEGLAGFFEYVKDFRDLHLRAIKKGCLEMVFHCLSLESLENLWSDYCSCRLNDFAEKCLVTNELKKKLNLKNVRLQITLTENNYLRCKTALMEMAGVTSSAGFQTHQATLGAGDTELMKVITLLVLFLNIEQFEQEEVLDQI